jgi:hypothetical protein
MYVVKYVYMMYIAINPGLLMICQSPSQTPIGFRLRSTHASATTSHDINRSESREGGTRSRPLSYVPPVNHKARRGDYPTLIDICRVRVGRVYGPPSSLSEGFGF